MSKIESISLYAQLPDIYDELYPRDWSVEEDIGFLHQLFHELQIDPETILDFGCGTGRHVNKLSEDQKAVGTDISQSMVDYASKKRQGQYQKQDMRDLSLDEDFDVAFSFYSSVCHLIRDEDLKQTFKSLNDVLTDQGLLVFDNQYHLTNQEREEGRRVFYFDDSKEDKEFFASLDVKLHDYGFLQESDRTYFVSRDGGNSYERFDESFQLRMLRPEEAQSLLEDCGFGLEAVLQNRSLTEYEEGNPATVSFVARKT